MPGADEFKIELMQNSDIFVFTYLMDEWQPHTCAGWAAHGNENIPPIVRGGTSMGFGGSGGLESLFYEGGGIPKRVFIDHELNVYKIIQGYQTETEIRTIINEMLENKEQSE